MRHAFHPEAEAEFLQAVDYYESCAPGLGHDFALEVYSAVGRIMAYPRAWPTLEGDVRRCLTGRFPYGILYVQAGEVVHVLAVMHLHRDPEHWKQRL